MCSQFVGIIRLQYCKILREYLALLAFVPFLLLSLAAALLGIFARTYWYIQFLYLVILSSTLTAGLCYDDLKTHNLDLLLSRPLSLHRIVLFKAAAAYLFGLFVPICAVLTATLILGQSIQDALQYAAVSLAALAFWTAAFSLLSPFLHPRFNWLLALSFFLLMPRWSSPDREGKVASWFAQISGFSAFDTLFHLRHFDVTLLLVSIVATGLLLNLQMLLLKERWLRN